MLQDIVVEFGEISCGCEGRARDVGEGVEKYVVCYLCEAIEKKEGGEAEEGRLEQVGG